MKILCVIPAYIPAHEIGGPVKTTHDLCKTLVRKGVEVSVYTTDVNAFSRVEVPLQKTVDVEGVKVTYFPVKNPVAYNYAPSMGKAIMKTVSGYDLVHIHSVYLPYILNPFGALDPDMIKMKNTFVKRVYIEFIEKRNINNAAFVQAASGYEKDKLLSLGVRSPVHVVPCAIDPEEYVSPCGRRILAEKYPHFRGKKIILFMGRIHPKKGLDLLGSAFAGIAEKREDIILVIAGKGEEKYTETVKTFFERKGLLNRTVFTGLLTGAEKISALHESDVFVLPSYGENFGIAVIEAMVCGLPVVVTDKVGLWPDVAEYDAGIVTKCDAGEIKEAILKLLENNGLRGEKSVNAGKLVEDRFILDKITDKMIKLYKSEYIRH